MKLAFFDDLFSEDELLYMMKFINAKQYIRTNKELAHYIFERCKHVLQSFDPTIKSVHDYVTISKHTTAIERHVDVMKENERYKVGIYLNDLTQGGTLFYSDTDTVHVHHKKGRLFIFDMSIPHEGEPLVNNETKYMIGIRVS
jgi:hypothetical protein